MASGALAGERGDVDDVAAAARDHAGNDGAHEQEGRAQVGGEHGVEVFDGHLVQRRADFADAGGVDEDVAAACLIDARGEGGDLRRQR